MLTRERRPDFKQVDRWAIGILQEAGAIHECDQHGWAKDRTDPHARAEALRIARNEPLAASHRTRPQRRSKRCLKASEIPARSAD
jgi:hypothetical protein